MGDDRPIYSGFKWNDTLYSNPITNQVLSLRRPVAVKPTNADPNNQIAAGIGTAATSTVN